MPTADPAVAFADVDAAILVGSMPRREGMERKDLLQANAKIFEVQGKALDKHAKKTVKVSISCDLLFCMACNHCIVLYTLFSMCCTVCVLVTLKHVHSDL